MITALKRVFIFFFCRAISLWNFASSNREPGVEVIVDATCVGSVTTSTVYVQSFFAWIVRFRGVFSVITGSGTVSNNLCIKSAQSVDEKIPLSWCSRSSPCRGARTLDRSHRDTRFGGIPRVSITGKMRRWRQRQTCSRSSAGCLLLFVAKS